MKNAHRGRRFFLLTSLGILSGLSARSHAADAPSHPNILFVFCDDQGYQALGAYGSTVAKTPSIDRIAKEGMRFDRCLTTYSLCGPARACVLTGKYSHLNGFFNNENSRFDGSQVTFPKLLQQENYQTAIVGKWHLVSDPTGFDFWEILPGQGRYYNPPMIRMGKPVPKSGYVSDIITDDAIEWLKRERDPARPFLLMVDHKAPHRNWEPALENLTKYDDTVFPEPPTLFDDYTGRGKAEHEQKMNIATTLTDMDLKLVPQPGMTPEQRKVWDAYYGPKNAAFAEKHLQGAELVRWKYQRYMHDYLATAASIDQSVGRLLDYLAQTGLDKNTVVIFSSDQGVFLGEHGWMDKRWIFEQSLRTPFLVRWPGVVSPGTVNTDMVSNLDFAETFLDIAGLPAPAEMQGRSIVPILKGRTPPDWRTDFYYHYYEHPAEHNVARQYGIVTDQYKLVYFYEPEMNYWELFDLKTDPLELKSVYNDPAYSAVQKDLHERLDKLRSELKVPATDPPQSMLR
jgi:arylsulfatase A-like enzyme